MLTVELMANIKQCVISIFNIENMGGVRWVRLAERV